MITDEALKRFGGVPALKRAQGRALEVVAKRRITETFAAADESIENYTYADMKRETDKVANAAEAASVCRRASANVMSVSIATSTRQRAAETNVCGTNINIAAANQVMSRCDNAVATACQSAAAYKAVTNAALTASVNIRRGPKRFNNWPARFTAASRSSRDAGG